MHIHTPVLIITISPVGQAWVQAEAAFVQRFHGSIRSQLSAIGLANSLGIPFTSPVPLRDNCSVYSHIGILTVTPQEFFKSHFSANKPILVGDGLKGWPALERWSPQGIGSLAPNRLVDLQVSLNGSFRANPDKSALDPENQFILRNVAFEKAANEIISNASLSTRYYIGQQNIALKLPELLPDLRCWWPVGSSVINLWFGSSGVITPLHFDKSANLFAQVYGTKTFTLFAPDQSNCLYPYPADCALPNHSYVDVEDPDWKRHPDFALAERYVITIEPGQMLFLPPFWWHHVESLSMSISVNQWRVEPPQRREQTSPNEIP